MVASVHRLQFVHSATSMIMFHFFMAHTFVGLQGSPSLRSFPRTRESSLCQIALTFDEAKPGSPRPRGRAEEGRHHFAGTNADGTLALRLTLGSGFASANAAEMCSGRRSHGSTSTSELAPAKACVDLVCERSGVSRLRQPPRSTVLPGSPMGA